MPGERGRQIHLNNGSVCDVPVRAKGFGQVTMMMGYRAREAKPNTLDRIEPQCAVSLRLRLYCVSRRESLNFFKGYGCQPRRRVNLVMHT